MAFKTILKTGGEKRELLTFSVRYFEAKNKHFSVKPKKNPSISLDELYLAAKSDPHAFRPAWGLPYGGLFELTMQSTADDDWLYEWMIPSKIFGTRFEKGVIEFYNDDDDYVPYKCIEFWDAFVADLSETMSSTGNQPMTLQLRISAATVRYNKLLVVQKNWFWTDINESTANHAEEESEPVISRIFWKGREEGDERKDIMLNHLLTLEVEFSEGMQGDEVELTVKQSKGRRIKGRSKEFTISGTIDENKMMIIPDFKVECDFAEDNQDFENIEFYHNERKVAEFKENFGWTYIKDGGITKVFCNLELQVDYIAPGCTEDDYMDAINNQFKRTLELSSGGAVSGKLFFSGLCVNDPPQVVPSLNTGVQGDKTSSDFAKEGSTIANRVKAESEQLDDTSLTMDFGESVVHELLHALRLDHPFYKKQADDSELVNKGGNNYETVENTDANIYYNIMNYNFISINGKKLDDLWKIKRPEYITKGQLDYVLNEIDSQQKGGGVTLDYSVEYAHKRTPWAIYWDPDIFPGTRLAPFFKVVYPDDVDYIESADKTNK